MGTAEILIVFSALMALIALVTIGIDWIGKPLKNRRFIPRIYRFDDEKLPVDAYGRTDFGTDFDTDFDDPEPVPAAAPRRARPRPVAQVEPTAVHHQPILPPTALPQTALAQTAAAAPLLAVHTRTAFSDSLAPAAPPEHGEIAGTGEQPSTAAAVPWEPGMALDTSVDDRKPSLATKAERFWVTTARSFSSSHFDDEDLARMAAGKAPRRTNPRNGKSEAMQLTGLRRASARTDVRMRWPDDSVDPWNAS